jgi:fluoride exporter
MSEDVQVSLPVEPDVGLVDKRSALGGSTPFGQARPPRWPKLRWDVLTAIFVGGCGGGWARYAITSTWPARSGRFPWATFAINVAGAFVLALVIVVAADVISSRYLRPLLGTGFCGAFTTFSAVVVTADQLVARHRSGIAALYLGATIAGGLAAASLGLVIGRTVAGIRRRAREGRNQS